MTTAAQPAAEASEKGARRVIVSEDLPLTVLTAVATTLVMNAIGLGRTFLYVGVALSPLVADVIKNAFRGLRKLWLSLLAALLVLLGTAGRALAARLRARQHRAIGWQAVTATALLSTVLTVAFFSMSELARGSAILAARKMTFFGAVHSKKVAPLRLQVPADFVVRALGPTAVTYRVSAQDPEDGPLAPICAPRSGAVFPVGPTIVHCSATDSRGIRVAKSFAVTVRRVPLVLGLPTTISLEAAGPTGVRAPYRVTAMNVDGRRIEPNCVPPSGSLFPIGKTSVMCTAVDGAGHRARGHFMVIVRDDKAPKLSLPGDLGGASADKSGRRFPFAATAVDDVDGTVQPTCDPASGSLFPIGTTTVTCTAKDAHGNVATGSFAVIVGKPTDDRMAPKLLLPADIRREATSRRGTVVTFRPSARDDVDGSVETKCVPASGTAFPLGRTTVRCSTHDAAANLARGTFVVTVVDTTPPTVAPLPDLTVEATSPNGATVSFKPSASDRVDGVVTPRCDPQPGATFTIGVTRVSCSATDPHGNHASGSFSVTVADTTPPTLKLPGPLTAEATSSTGASVAYTVSATDVATGTITPKCSPPPGPFPLGQTTVTCTATDAHGNRTSGSFSVTVADTTPPALKLPSTLTAEATSSTGASVAYTVSATDVATGTITPKCSPPPGPFPLGQTTVTCTATDGHGNRASGSFTVNVADTTPPTLKLPGSLRAEATSGAGANVKFGVSAVDTVSGAVTPTCSAQPGAFPLGQTTVTCNAADARGNRASGSFTVSVVDTTPPTLDLPGNLTFTAGADKRHHAWGATVSFIAGAVDAVDQTLPVSCSIPTGTFIATDQTIVKTISCTAVDTRGNTASGSFDVTIQMPPPPPRSPRTPTPPPIGLTATPIV